ncbi:MAG: 2-dehydropantoate 2-reductase [Candidatus Velthaea sp.]
MLRYAVVGAGAIGAYVGAAIARTGAEVWLVARGAHLEAMRQNGVHVLSERGDFHAQPHCTSDCSEVGEVDVVIIALKAHQTVDMIDAVTCLVGPTTSIISMQNGIPWWYFQDHGGPLEGTTLNSVDPGGILANAFDPKNVIGCAVYSSTEIARPGVIQHIEGTRYTLGHPNGEITPRLIEISETFIAGGLKAPAVTDLRAELWTKLLGNVCFNPISALTRATLEDMATDPLIEPLIRQMMTECANVAKAVGIEIPVSIDKRIDGARRVGKHKSSTLQDVEAGRAMELDCIVGAVVEIGDLVGVDVSATRHVYGMTKLLDRMLAAQRLATVHALPTRPHEALQQAV